jgi:uncharacterized damage-inducible protein DinB
MANTFGPTKPRIFKEALSLRLTDGEWTVGKLLSHIANSEAWFRYCLIGEDWTDFEEITNVQALQKFLEIIAKLDSKLMKEVAKTDQELVITAGDQIIHATRSLILSQAVMHAAEHKGQIASILKLNGYHIDLDDLDV